MSVSQGEPSQELPESTCGGKTLVETVLERFRAEWNPSNPSRIDAALASSAANGESRQTLLRELVLLDLECRWQLAAADSAGTLALGNASRPRLTDYAQQFPELASAETWSPAILAREFRLRQKYDAHCALDEYLREYPEHAVMIREALSDSQFHDQTVSVDPHATLAEQTTWPDPRPSVTQESNPAVSEPFFGAIGDYEVLEEIARGGMGIVYKARHRKLGRLAAVKVILNARFASEEQVQRFYAEAEAAAHLDHPGIVTVFEVGEHEGQHFLAMAYVDGQSLSQRVKAGPLAPQEAALLMQHAAEAVHYAHTQGVVHRDLKPQNILLTRDNVPRVTDFGLAKRMSSESHLTIDGQIIGTPSYMPPEQAAGRVSAAGPPADVYSLGATLYCLLTGRPPFQAATMVETVRQVLETEPATPQLLNPATPADLETICLKCLQKDPSKRYGTAAELADDLGRYLRHEPIKARPVGQMERAARWCRRYPTIAALTTAVALALVVGTTVSTYFAFAASKSAKLANTRALDIQQKNEELTLARNRAEAERVRAETVSKFLLSVFQKPHPSLSDQDLTVSQLLEQAKRDLLADTNLDVATRAALLGSLGTTYLGLGKPNEAIPLLEQAHSLYLSTVGPKHRRTLATACDLALAYRSTDKLEGSLELYRATINEMQTSLGPDHEDTLIAQSNLAQAMHQNKQSQEALNLLAKVRAALRRSLGGDHFATLAADNNAAAIYCDLGDHAQAIQIYKEGLVAIRPTLNDDHPHVLTVTVNLANALAADGEWKAARDTLEPIFEKIRRQFGPMHPQTVFAGRNLASIYAQVGETAKAASLRREFDRRTLPQMTQANPGSAISNVGNISVGMGSRNGPAQSNPGGPSVSKGLPDLPSEGPSAVKGMSAPIAEGKGRCMEALEHLAAGRLAEYQAACESLSKETIPGFRVEYLTAAVARSQPEDVAKALVTATEKIAELPEQVDSGNRLLAAAYYRAGDYEQALNQFRKVYAQSGLRSWDHCLIALCYFQQNDRDRAERNLNLARERQASPSGDRPLLVNKPVEDLATTCLLKEAEKLIGGAK